MEELELKDYQERFINSKEKLVIGNFARGMGKTFCLAQKIIKEKPEKVLVYSKTYMAYIGVIDKITDIPNDIFIDDIFHVNKERTIITWNNNKKTTIFFENDKDLMCQYSADLAIFEDIYCLENYKALDEYIRKQDSFVQIICTTTENNYDKHLQKNFPSADIIEVDILQGIRENLIDINVIIEDFTKADEFSFYNELAILSNPNINKSITSSSFVTNGIIVDNSNFLEKTLNNLIKEYESIPIQNNTTMTRQNILNMILNIENTRNNIIKIDPIKGVSSEIQKQLYEEDMRNFKRTKESKDKLKETIWNEILLNEYASR